MAPTASLIKEVKMGARTEKHDVEFKVKHIDASSARDSGAATSLVSRPGDHHPELGRTQFQ